MGRVASQTNFYFGLKKIGWKIKLHQTGNENKIELRRSHFNKWKCKRQSHKGNFSGEIVFSHDTCHVAEQDNSDSQVFFVRRWLFRLSKRKRKRGLSLIDLPNDKNRDWH